MNKTLVSLIFAAALACAALYGVGGRDVWVYEDFSSGEFPPTGWTISSNASNWGLFSGANAGGTTPELRFNWSPTFTGTTYFISPSFDTSGETTVYLDFRHFVDYYTNPFTVGVATRSAQGAWNTVWSVNPSANVGPALETAVINNADVGSTDFQFAFFFTGNSYNIDYWYIDNIKFYTPFPYDLALVGTDLPGHITAGLPVTPSCTVSNVGMNDLTAMVSLNIYRGDTLEASYPDYFSAFLSFGQTQTVTFPDFTPALPDELYRFEYSVSSLEDVVDNDLANNGLTAYVNTWTGTKQMVVLEIGTGAWCTYCPGAALAAEDFINQQYNVAVIENHNGDPYANDTSNARNTYYGISGFPTGIFDGLLSHVGGNHTTSVFPSYLPLYEQRNNVKTPVNLDIYGEETRTYYDITIRVDKFAPLWFPNLVMHLALTESGITYAWQGQTHLEYVDRMMYPTHEGTPFALADAPLGITDLVLNINKSDDWVTENCELVAFIQNLDTKEIIQANKVWLTELVAPPVSIDDELVQPVLSVLGSITPNPFSARASIAYTLKEGAPVDIGVYNLKGQLVRTLVSETKAGGAHSVAWDGRDRNGSPVANGAYLVRMQSGGNTSTRKLMLIK
jgi:hypothetical protein